MRQVVRCLTLGAIVFLAGVLVNDTPSAVKAMGLLALGLVGRAVAVYVSRSSRLIS